MSNRDWIARGDEVLMQTYSRFPAVMVKGEGCRLWDADDPNQSLLQQCPSARTTMTDAKDASD